MLRYGQQLSDQAQLSVSWVDSVPWSWFFIDGADFFEVASPPENAASTALSTATASARRTLTHRVRAASERRTSVYETGAPPCRRTSLPRALGRTARIARSDSGYFCEPYRVDRRLSMQGDVMDEWDNVAPGLC